MNLREAASDLGLEDTDEVLMVLETIATDAYENGYESGYDDGVGDCDCDEFDCDDE